VSEAHNQQEGVVSSASNMVRARNLRKVDALLMVRSGEIDGLALTKRVCEGQLQTVDAWTCKTSKCTFPGGSVFKGFLLARHRGGSLSLGEVTNEFEIGSDIRDVSGVGKKTAKVLEDVFGIKQVGQLAALTFEEADRIEAQIKSENLVGAFGHGLMRKLVQRAIAMATDGTMEVASEDEDDDDGQLLHETEGDTQVWHEVDAVHEGSHNT